MKKKMEYETVVGTSMEAAEEYLRRGLCVGLPTETVYGLAANGLSSSSALLIFATKQRPSFDPLILHIPSLMSADPLLLGGVASLPPTARLLADSLWPGPLTLLLPRHSRVPDEVTSGLPRVALRVPAHPLARQLLQRLDFPLAAPSANPFGYISPTTAQHVLDQLGGKLPYILDGGPCPIGVESTIVGFEGDDNLLTIYRLGGISLERIRQVVGPNVPIALQQNQSSNPAAPGMLKVWLSPFLLLSGSFPLISSLFISPSL